MKICFKCNKKLPINRFYVHKMMADGHLGKCKECTKRDTKSRIDRLWKTDPAWVGRERVRCRAKQERLRKLGLASPTRAETRNKWATANQHKIKAERIAAYAFRAGTIIKPKYCNHCCKKKDLEMHHPDYSQPLAVEWICTKCHGRTRWKS